ncbi:zinc finger protein 32-like [Cydia fagiglandana]|uniref:zinc finger protein 32-like n=1 Tax=Cydia fagiglandana TaxID=1458189 RepID=UPI002FEE10E3
MNVMSSCRCCMRCPADKDLTTPYTHLGNTEVYADMLRECFDLRLWVSPSIFSGICSGCVGRLRDASDFKLQVQLSQVELLAQLQGYRLEEKEPTYELEEDEPSEELMAPEEPAVIVEKLEEDLLQDDILSSKSNEESSPMTFAYSVQLERLRQGLRARPRRKRVPRHAPNHTPPYQCHDCGSRFQLKKEISRHIQYNCIEGPLALMNRNIKRYGCKHCTYTSRNERNLHFHELRHRGEKPYRCDSCAYKTTRKGDFERHQSIHTGDKPFQCNVCDYKCIQKHTLLIHMRRHTGEKPYTCKQCNRQFRQIQCLRKHQRGRHQKKPNEISPRLRISRKMKNLFKC